MQGQKLRNLWVEFLNHPFYCHLKNKVAASDSRTQEFLFLFGQKQIYFHRIKVRNNFIPFSSYLQLNLHHQMKTNEENLLNSLNYTRVESVHLWVRGQFGSLDKSWLSSKRCSSFWVSADAGHGAPLGKRRLLR